MATTSAFANANSVVTTGWTNPTNGYADDGSYATAAPAKSTSITTDWGFPAFSSIPANSVINTTTAELQYKSDTTGSTGAVIGLQINNNGTLLGTETTFGMNLADQTVTKGQTGTITLANLLVANGVKARVRGFRSTSNTAITWSADYLKLTVDYTPGYVLTASSGTFAMTGQAATLKASRLLSAGTGSFVMTGESATLGKRYTMTASAGTFALSGQSAGLLARRLLTAASGAFAMTGEAATLTASKLMAASPGVFAMLGADALLAAARLLEAAAGVFAMTGSDATLTYTPAAPEPPEPTHQPRARVRHRMIPRNGHD